jgi:hypothetical protein
MRAPKGEVTGNPAREARSHAAGLSPRLFCAGKRRLSSLLVIALSVATLLISAAGLVSVPLGPDEAAWADLIRNQAWAAWAQARGTADRRTTSGARPHLPLCRGEERGGRPGEPPPAHPFYWAPFVLTGDWY